MVYLQLAAGFGLLMLGGDWVVRSCVRLAFALGVSPLVVSVLVIGFGTSLPELLTSVDAALVGAPGIALGNVIGSNIANVLLILGTGAMLQPIACSLRTTLRQGGAMLIVSAAAALVISVGGGVSRAAGGAFVAGLVVYLALICLTDRSHPLTLEQKAGPRERATVMLRAGAGAIASLAAIALGAHWLVESAVALAGVFGVPETVIGLTVIAIGSSLPELAATIAAALRGRADVAFGNVLGSNVFNLLGVLGVTACIAPIAAGDRPLGGDLLVMLASAGAMLLFALYDRRLTRGEGTVMLLAYLAYLGFLAAS